MFQFPEFALPKLCIHLGVTLAAGFPHSDIGGSKLYCQLPAAFRRLTRLSSLYRQGHSPHALIRLTL